MSTHIQHPGNPKRTRCGRRITGLVVYGYGPYGPYGTCLSCLNQYAADLASGGGAQ